MSRAGLAERAEPCGKRKVEACAHEWWKGAHRDETGEVAVALLQVHVRAPNKRLVDLRGRGRVAEVAGVVAVLKMRVKVTSVKFERTQAGGRAAVNPSTFFTFLSAGILACSWWPRSTQNVSTRAFPLEERTAARAVACCSFPPLDKLACKRTSSLPQDCSSIITSDEHAWCQNSDREAHVRGIVPSIVARGPAAAAAATALGSY